MEADYEKGARDYYERSIQMGRAWNAIKEDKDEALRRRDHYQQEGLHQNALVKELLAEKVGLLKEKANLERATRIAKEDRLNYKEKYEIAAEEALEVVKAQKALECIIAHMEA